jgi:hypothetical protein
MIAVHVVHGLVMGKAPFHRALRGLFAALGVAVILACGWTELDAARAAPWPSRDRVGKALEKAVRPAAAVKLRKAPEGECKRGQLGAQVAEGTRPQRSRP